MKHSRETVRMWFVNCDVTHVCFNSKRIRNPVGRVIAFWGLGMCQSVCVCVGGVFNPAAGVSYNTQLTSVRLHFQNNLHHLEPQMGLSWGPWGLTPSRLQSQLHITVLHFHPPNATPSLSDRSSKYKKR